MVATGVRLRGVNGHCRRQFASSRFGPGTDITLFIANATILALSMNIPSLKRLTEQQGVRAMQTFFPAKRQNWDNMSRKRAVARSTEPAVQRGGRRRSECSSSSMVAGFSPKVGLAL